jgi:hypothetical protein
MPKIDPDDDRLHRYVVRHYRYDSERRERRHVVVAAFDNRREFWECFHAAWDEIELRRANGEDVHPSEHVSGIEHEPGYRRRAANGRLIVRALRRGVWVPWVDDLELPSSMATYRASE